MKTNWVLMSAKPGFLQLTPTLFLNSLHRVCCGVLHAISTDIRTEHPYFNIHSHLHLHWWSCHYCLLDKQQSAVSEDRTHSITSQITDTATATYIHTLTMTGRLVGGYECNVSNNKPSSASGVVAVVGKNYKYTDIFD